MIVVDSCYFSTSSVVTAARYYSTISKFIESSEFLNSSYFEPGN